MRKRGFFGVFEKTSKNDFFRLFQLFLNFSQNRDFVFFQKKNKKSFCSVVEILKSRTVKIMCPVRIYEDDDRSEIIIRRNQDKVRNRKEIIQSKISEKFQILDIKAGSFLWPNHFSGDLRWHFCVFTFITINILLIYKITVLLYWMYIHLEYIFPTAPQAHWAGAERTIVEGSSRMAIALLFFFSSGDFLSF